jgi:uncharacterized protein (DUF924 family)
MSRRKRKAIPLEQKLAAALACLLPQAQRDELRHARVPAKAVIKLFTMHHLDYWTFSEDDHWSNLDPMLRAPHEARFAKDAAAIAKVKRLERQFRPEVIGGMVALVEVMDRQMPHQPRRKAAGAFSGPAAAKPRTKRKIAQRRSPWPPKGSRTFKATRGIGI